MRAIAQERRRFGYRRLHVLLKREGYVINHKKLFRLYREERRCAMPRAPRQLPPLPPPNRANPTAGANSGMDKTWGQGQTQQSRYS
jgi:transposase InsO family protein